nr:MAG TPA: Integrase [Caudoviricetes sp.]
MIPRNQNYCIIFGAATQAEHEFQLAVIFIPIFKEDDFMAKKKKYPNLPNGFGSIRKLSGNRNNPYAVHPPVKKFCEDGKPVTPKALCYVSDWYVGFSVLMAYKAGTYKPGLEKELEIMRAMEDGDLHGFTKKLLADYTIAVRPEQADKGDMTFTQLYEKYYAWKYKGKKQYSKASMDSVRAAFKNCKAIHSEKIKNITYEQLQRIVDGSTLKHASLELIVSLLKQMYKYALAQNLVEKNPTELLRINIPDDDEHGVPFSIRDMERLWNHDDNDIAQILLIMCYSGYRIGELKVIKTDLEKRCFSGGLKTRTSKNRIVPIHSAIFPIVEKRIKKYGVIMPLSDTKFRGLMKPYIKSIGIGEHTPHDCRHTFSSLCEKYEVKENDRKRMLGHKFTDITNGVYGHRVLGDLRKEIEKIPCLKCVENGTLKSSQKEQIFEIIQDKKMA